MMGGRRALLALYTACLIPMMSHCAVIVLLNGYSKQGVGLSLAEVGELASPSATKTGQGWEADVSAETLPQLLKNIGCSAEVAVGEGANGDECKDIAGAKAWKVFDRAGVRLQQEDLLSLSDDDRIWLVASHRLFMWPATFVGDRVTLNRMDSFAGKDKPIELETVSLSPRVFNVHNFMSASEADRFISLAMNLTSDEFKLKRSSVGVGTKKNTKSSVRTSQNAFDTTSPSAMAFKRRSFELLGLEGFDNRLADGLQLVRYAPGEAYLAHHDYFPLSETRNHNWDPRRGGTNRFATVFLYLNDVDEGGQTVFPRGKAAKADDDDDDDHHHISSSSSSGSPVSAAAFESLGLEKQSWERKMVDVCYSALSVRPKKGNAIIFYSQTPWGGLDDKSLHGGCPVLKGLKWAANLWVWNGPRFGEPGAPPGDDKARNPNKIRLRLENAMPSTVLIYWVPDKGVVKRQTQVQVLAGNSVNLNTFHGHSWQARTEAAGAGTEEVLLMSWRMDRETGPEQRLAIAHAPGQAPIVAVPLVNDVSFANAAILRGPDKEKVEEPTLVEQEKKQEKKEQEQEQEEQEQQEQEEQEEQEQEHERRQLGRLTISCRFLNRLSSVVEVYYWSSSASAGAQLEAMSRGGGGMEKMAMAEQGLSFITDVEAGGEAQVDSYHGHHFFVFEQPTAGSMLVVVDYFEVDARGLQLHADDGKAQITFPIDEGGIGRIHTALLAGHLSSSASANSNANADSNSNVQRGEL